MSIHRSLVSNSGLKRPRNVLSRSERLDVLEKEDKWKEGNSIFALPKVKGEKKIKKIKSGGRGAKKDEAATGDAAVAAPVAPAGKTPAGKTPAAKAPAAKAPAAKK